MSFQQNISSSRPAYSEATVEHLVKVSIGATTAFQLDFQLILAAHDH